MMLRAMEPDRGLNEATSPIWIRLLGSVLLYKAGKPAPVGAGTKMEALLCLLGIHHKVGVVREALLTDLWPSQDSVLAAQSLNSLISNVRRQLGPALQGANPVLFSGGSYHLNFEAGIGVDVARFEAFVQQGNQELHRGDRTQAMLSYHRAIELYHGDLWYGIDIYAIMERERLRTCHLTVLGQMADYYFEQALYPASLDCAQRLIASDPCREDAHRLMMRCYVHQGQRAQALHHYHFCESLLKTECAIEPELATTALYEQIRQTPESV